MSSKAKGTIRVTLKRSNRDESFRIVGQKEINSIYQKSLHLTRCHLPIVLCVFSTEDSILCGHEELRLGESGSHIQL